MAQLPDDVENAMSAAIVFGVVFFITAIILFSIKTFSTQKRLDQLMSSSKQKLGEILSIFAETKKDLGELGAENTVSEKLTVKGKVHTDMPLTSPLGQRECLYYTYKVTAKRTERYTERDSNGNDQQRTRTVYDTLDQGDNSTRFWLDDGTGKVLVDPKGGKFEGLTKSVERSESQFTPTGGMLSVGFLSLSIPTGGGRPETITYVEEIIGLDRPLTVIGTLCDKMGELMIESVKKTPVIVSTLSQEEMIERAQSSAKKLIIGAIACGVIGAILIVVGLVV